MKIALNLIFNYLRYLYNFYFFKMKYLLTLLYLFIFLFCANAQTIKELERKRKKTEEELAIAQKMLGKTEQEKIQNINTLAILKSQIGLRNKLLNDIEQQVIFLENEVDKNELLIAGLTHDLLKLKNEYAKLTRFAWRNRSHLNIILFIFASNDFNQAYRRIKFYQQFLKFREKQGKEILNTQKMIESEVLIIKDNKVKLTKTKQEKEREVKSLKTDEVKYKNAVTSLQQKEKQIRKELEERKKSIDALNKEISDLIAEEAKKAAKDKAGSIRDARYIKLSDGFAGNRGKLPWPVKSGIIIGDFGEHNHPVIKGLKVKNNGIDISTDIGAKVMSIFEGEVKKIVPIPGANTAVIVRHGDYLSVYSNLEKVSVKVGENLKLGQVIGEVYTDKASGKAIFNLQIWKESTIQNPANWILP
jgi:murein hydrolase activator